jgi:hypothetical protein
MNRQSAVVILILSAPLQPSQAAEYRHPGVYVQEGPGPKRIDGVNTSTNFGQVRIVRACGQKCARKKTAYSRTHAVTRPKAVTRPTKALWCLMRQHGSSLQTDLFGRTCSD